MYEENYEKLANTIILFAVKDFRTAYRRLEQHPNDTMAQGEIQSITRFFCSQYFTLFTTLDGPELLQKIIDELEGGDAQ